MIDIKADIEAVSRIPMVDNILEVICRTTGMGFAAVARVTEDRWVACGVRDEINFGLKPGGELQLETTICNEIRQSGKEVVIDSVVDSAEFCKHHTPAMYGFQSYISLPIYLNDGSFFGTLCAIDPKPAKLDNPAIRGMFKLFADMIAHHLGMNDKLTSSEHQLQDERRISKLREQFNTELSLTNKKLESANEELAATQDSLQILVDELTESESHQARLASIVESSEDAIISKTLQGIITSWNKSAERVFGYTADEVIGKHISILIPDERIAEEEIIIGKVSNNESLEHFETYRVTKEGKHIPISLTVSPIRNKNGQVIGASKIVRDISRQKQSEAKLQSYAENLEVLNSMGQIISANLDVQDILQKVTDATTRLSGAEFGAFFHNLVNEKGESYMLFTLSGAPREAFEKFGMPRNTKVFAPTFTGEGIVRVDDIRKDPRYGHNSPHYGMPKGHLPVVSYLAVPVISKNGNVIGGLFYGHPEPGKFTEEDERIVAGVAAQAAIALDNAKLYQEIKILNAKKDEFIGLASHELKTPVTSISGYLQIIERTLALDDRNKQFVTKARSQVNKLTSLISDLLDVSKIQTGKMPINKLDFDLKFVLTEVADMMQESNATHQIELNFEAGPLVIHADQQRIEQVIINLISNAIKYSPGADRVIVTASADDKKVRVTVKDFGIGIDPDQYERIFTRFYRVENLAAHMSGLGIGLYISHEIISRHEGSMWVESKPEEGSTFYFELPVH